MEYKELKTMIDKENTFVRECKLQHLNNEELFLTFNYKSNLDFADFYHLPIMIVNQLLTDQKNSKEFDIDYSMEEAFITYSILKEFTDLPLEDDISLAYSLNVEYNIIDSIAENDPIFCKNVEQIYKVVWKYLDYEKHNQISKVVKQIIDSIQTYLAEFGLDKMKMHDIDINDFIDKYIKNEELKSIKQENDITE